MEILPEIQLAQHPIKLNHRYHLDFEEGEISIAGRTRIANLVHNFVRRNWGHSDSPNESLAPGPWYSSEVLPHDFSWEWIDESGRKLTTRISDFIRDVYSISNRYLSELKADVGNVIQSSRMEQASMDFDFVPEIHWIDGDFNDKDSCFWWGRGKVLLYINDSPYFYAIRIFKSGTSEGVGRAIIYNNPEKDYFYLMNAYGVPLGQLTSILASWLDIPYELSYRLRFIDSRRGANLFYLNNGEKVSLLGDGLKGASSEIPLSLYDTVLFCGLCDERGATYSDKNAYIPLCETCYLNNRDSTERNQFADISKTYFDWSNV